MNKNRQINQGDKYFPSYFKLQQIATAQEVSPQKAVKSKLANSRDKSRASSELFGGWSEYEMAHRYSKSGSKISKEDRSNRLFQLSKAKQKSKGLKK